jgi:hypothetical protein
VVGPEFARLNTGVSITRGNRGNGARLTRESKKGENKKARGKWPTHEQTGDCPVMTVWAYSVELSD